MNIHTWYLLFTVYTRTSVIWIVIWDGALWFWSVIKTIMTDYKNNYGNDASHYKHLRWWWNKAQSFRSRHDVTLKNHTWLVQRLCHIVAYFLLRFNIREWNSLSLNTLVLMCLLQGFIGFLSWKNRCTQPCPHKLWWVWFAENQFLQAASW